MSPQASNSRAITISTSPSQIAIASTPPHQTRLQPHHQKPQTQPVRHLTGTTATRGNLELVNIIHVTGDEESANRDHVPTSNVIDEDFYF